MTALRTAMATLRAIDPGNRDEQASPNATRKITNARGVEEWSGGVLKARSLLIAAQRDELRCIRLGRKVLFRIADVEEWLARNTTGGGR